MTKILFFICSFIFFSSISASSDNKKFLCPFNNSDNQNFCKVKDKKSCICSEGPRNSCKKMLCDQYKPDSKTCDSVYCCEDDDKSLENKLPCLCGTTEGKKPVTCSKMLKCKPYEDGVKCVRKYCCNAPSET